MSVPVSQLIVECICLQIVGAQKYWFEQLIQEPFQRFIMN